MSRMRINLFQMVFHIRWPGAMRRCLFVASPPRETSQCESPGQTTLVRAIPGCRYVILLCYFPTWGCSIPVVSQLGSEWSAVCSWSFTSLEGRFGPLFILQSTTFVLQLCFKMYRSAE